jgi:anti-sigma factor RsiW
MTEARSSKGCQAALVELSRYVDGELTPARRRGIERHLKSCACCTAIADRIRVIAASCRGTGPQGLPEDVRRRARARIKTLLGT